MRNRKALADKEKRFGNPQDRPVRVVLIAKEEQRFGNPQDRSEGGFNCKEDAQAKRELSG